MAAPKQPQDHKISAVEAEALKTPFEFVGVDGATYELPVFSVKAAGITSGTMRRNRGNELELMYLFLEALASPEALAATDEFDFEKLGDLFKEWQEHSGVELPKS